MDRLCVFKVNTHDVIKVMDNSFINLTSLTQDDEENRTR